MTFREFLQIELWSKETSGKILQRVWKIAKPASAVFGALILLLGIVFAVEWYWLTSGEKAAARAALAKIEELERTESNPGDGFDLVNQQAKSLTKAADQKAWTLRDRQTAGLLELYRWEVETGHEDRVRVADVRAFVEETHQKWYLSPNLEKKLRDSQEQIYISLRTELHRELD